MQEGTRVGSSANTGKTLGALVGAALMLAAAASCVSAADDRLKGNVIKDGNPRVSRPQTPAVNAPALKGAVGGASLQGQAAAGRMQSGLDSAAFNLKAARARLPAAVQAPSWSDSMPQYDNAAELRSE